jgi:hypothetical protein
VRAHMPVPVVFSASEKPTNLAMGHDQESET